VAIGQSAGGCVYSRYIAFCFQKSEIELPRQQTCLGSPTGQGPSPNDGDYESSLDKMSHWQLKRTCVLKGVRGSLILSDPSQVWKLDIFFHSDNESNNDPLLDTTSHCVGRDDW
ncbi:hypothetical protein HAX54_034734, partial [Datura stramonium]|nr:hypothetical protein [Datura stramonium]